MPSESRLLVIVALTKPVVPEGPVTLNVKVDVVLSKAKTVTVLLDSKMKTCWFWVGRKLKVVALLVSVYVESPLHSVLSVKVPEALFIH